MQALAKRGRRAVKLRGKEMLVNDVPRECELSRSTVIAAHKAYCIGGWAEVVLKPRWRPTGVGQRLSAEQKERSSETYSRQDP